MITSGPCEGIFRRGSLRWCLIRLNILCELVHLYDLTIYPCGKRLAVQRRVLLARGRDNQRVETLLVDLA